jgi:hypothetical protein
MPTLGTRGGRQQGVSAGQTGLQVRPGSHQVATQERHGSHCRQTLLHEACMALALC